MLIYTKEVLISHLYQICIEVSLHYVTKDETSLIWLLSCLTRQLD